MNRMLSVWCAWPLALSEGLGAALVAGGIGDDDPERVPAPGSPVYSVHAAASLGLTESGMRAVNGWITVSYKDGSRRCYYVGHGPQWIADQLRAAKAAGLMEYSYWARLGMPEDGPVVIAVGEVVHVEPEFLEPDLDALYEGSDQWVLA